MYFADIFWTVWAGAGMTLKVVGLALLYGIPFAALFGILQAELRGWKQWPVTALIEFWRSSPIVILLFVFYYSLPAFHIELSALAVGAMVLGMNIGGYGSQAVRAGIQALERGQSEAGDALGLTRFDVITRILLPQALRAGIPTYINLLIQLIKGTSLVSLMSLAEMTLRAKDIAQVTFAPAAPYTALLLSYFIICYPMTMLGRYLERRLATGSRQ